MDKENDIESALRQAFFTAVPAAAANNHALTELENETFESKGKPQWYSLFFMPNRPVVKSLGLDGDDEFTGLFQIHFHVPLGSGKAGVDELAQALRLGFTPRARCLYGSANVIIKSCGRVGGSKESNSYVHKFSVSWECRLSRHIQEPG